MTTQTNFKRYELKYLLSDEQLHLMQEAMQGRMQPDRFFSSTVRSLYFDTDSCQLIRHSLEHPVYKEKLRLRSYGRAEADSPVFVELKKKYQSVVYKRRIALPLGEAEDWIRGGALPDTASRFTPGALPDTASRFTPGEQQILHEIEYFINFYQTLAPAALITCDRTAYTGIEQPDLRITFDTDVLARTHDMSLGGEIYGTGLLPEGKTLMEIKTGGGMPLWLTDALTRGRIYRQTFSKYGAAYQTLIYPAGRAVEHRKGERRYA